MFQDAQGSNRILTCMALGGYAGHVVHYKRVWSVSKVAINVPVVPNVAVSMFLLVGHLETMRKSTGTKAACQGYIRVYKRSGPECIMSKSKSTP